MPGNSQNPTPCQEDRNCCHHWRSNLNSWLRRIGWSLYQQQHIKLIILQRKVLPCHTTLAVWCWWPVRDSISCLLHQSHRSQDWSSGRRAICWMESNSMPRTVSDMAGPTHLLGWRGWPSLLQMVITVLRFSAHWGDWGGPVVMKLSI